MIDGGQVSFEGECVCVCMCVYVCVCECVCECVCVCEIMHLCDKQS